MSALLIRTKQKLRLNLKLFSV